MYLENLGFPLAPTQFVPTIIDLTTMESSG